MKKISQREARALRKRVAALEEQARHQRRAWARDYPGGVHIGSQAVDPLTIARIATARKLGHPVVAVPCDQAGLLDLYAVA